MKKTNGVFSAIMALALVLGLCVGCNGNQPSPTNSNQPPIESGPDQSNQPQEGVSYEFLGEYTELQEFGFNFAFLGLMNADGTGAIYTLQKSEDSEATLSDTPVTWNCEEDRDGVVTFILKMDNDESTIYQEDNGTFLYTYHFEFANGYSRDAVLTGSSEIKYETVDAWRTDMEEKFAAGENGNGAEGENEDGNNVSYTFFGNEVLDANGAICDNMGAEIRLYEDGTAEADRGYSTGDSLGYVYSTETGTWSLEEKTLTITINDRPYITEEADGGYTFTWETSSDEEGTLTAVVFCSTPKN